MDPPEREELDALIAAAPPGDRTAAGIIDAAALLSLRIPERSPSPHLKSALFQKISTPRTPPTPPPFRLIEQAVAGGGWLSYGTPGAYLKLLNVDQERGFAVVLGKLDAGCVYPDHVHEGPEELFMLSGDLLVGDRRLQAGDYHHSEAGTAHHGNRSEQGCTLIAVVTGKKMVAQLAAIAAQSVPAGKD